MLLRGSVQDPETRRYYLLSSAYRKEITAAQETAKRTLVESSKTIINNKMSNTLLNNSKQGPA